MDGHARRLAFVDDVAATVREVLRERWPSVGFEIVPRPSASWVRFDIHWYDGPTRLLVNQVVEATVASLDDGRAPRLEANTRRTLSEEGVAAALVMVAGAPPSSWLLPNGHVSWVRFSLPEASSLMEEFILPERPVSAHHLAALVANRLDLTFALDHGGHRASSTGRPQV